MLCFRAKPREIQCHFCTLKLLIRFKLSWQSWVTDGNRSAQNNFGAIILRIALGLQQFDGDVAEGRVGEVAGDVGETAAREVRFAVLELKMDFGLVQDGVHDVGRSKRNINVIVVVLVELRVLVRRDFHVVHADVFIFDFQVMMRLAGHVSPRKRNRLLRLGTSR